VIEIGKTKSKTEKLNQQLKKKSNHLKTQPKKKK